MNLQDYGFAAPISKMAASAEEASCAAASMGFPVALKVVSPDILHKTDVGGVELNLHSESNVASAFHRIMRSVAEKAPDAHIEGIEVQEMCTEGAEIIIGLHNEAQFGPVIMFGLGGTLTEWMNDVSFRVLPISRDDAASMLQEIRGRSILDGFRGQTAVSKPMLIDMLMQASRMGMDLADRLEAADFNPIRVWDGQHRVIDFKLLIRSQPIQVPENEPDLSHLDLFFRPKTVAVVGASSTPGKIGNSVLDSLVNHQYEGHVYPVNPGRDEVMGLKAYPSLSKIPEPIDLVVVTVPLTLVPDLIQEAAAQGIHNMVIISGGGKELGGESQEIEAAIKRLAAEKGVRIIGCNCIGVFDGKTRLDTFFQIHERMLRPKLGPVAMITQSGTVGAAFLENADAMGISKFVSYGNRIDVDEGDLIAYLGEDPGTSVIVSYIEGLSDGRKFLATARRVSKKKPIVVYKAGRSQQAATMAMSHTGFFGGTQAVILGALRQAGVIAVDDFEEMLAVAGALALQPRAHGNRIAMISNGAGTMVQAMDLLGAYGLEMGALSTQSIEKLRQTYPPFYLVQNPIDVTGSAVSKDYEIGVQTLLEDPGVDIIMPWFVFQDTPLEETIVDVLRRLSERFEKPILCGATGGPYTEKMSMALWESGIPVYSSVRTWMAAAKGLAG
jgi:3-hydroxypropionyl-CoA synthetase (ADP-forming)